MTQRLGVEASRDSAPVRSSFARHLDRTYQRAVRARAAAENMPLLASAARTRLAGDVSGPGDDNDVPMAGLIVKLDLRPEQRDLVWAIVACSCDPRIVPHLEALGTAHARRGLSLSVYALLSELDADMLLGLSDWLASSNPLLATGLLVATEPASPAARAYVASPRLVRYLAGRDDEPMPPLRLVDVDRPLVHDSAQSESIQAIVAALGRSPDPVIVIEGPVGSGRATAAASATEKPIILLDCARVRGEQLEDALIALRREALLRSGVPIVANADHLLGDEQRHERALLSAYIDHTSGPVVLTVTVPGTDLGAEKPLVRIAWDVPGSTERAHLWSVAVSGIGASLRGDVSGLASRYRVGPAAIERAVSSVRLLHGPGAVIDEAALVVGLRHNIAERLGGLAQRIEVTQSWEDLVIAEDTGDLIGALIGRIRHAPQALDQWGYRTKIARGTGVAALFSGPPGTGKTMVAGLVARELDLELYQVDLSKIVSKWIGETEKNLARVFDAAEEGHALLLFDEADALFGQRSADMRSATDRYANLEVNYLLQRVEAFGGITILTTNLETAIDDALMRRLAAHIVFAKPEEAERALLWQRQCFTGRAPIARDVNTDALASMFPHMSGANIRNAALAAAFLAAGEGAPGITQDHLIRAARAEYRSMGHVLSEAISSRTKQQSTL